jgi:rhodanese-related sulfurtransferase
MKSILPFQLHERQLRGEAISLLDVRTPAEHDEVHVPGVRLVPLDRLDPGELASVDGFAKDRPVYILCRSGNRARQAAEKLEKSGFAECHVVEGGLPRGSSSSAVCSSPISFIPRLSGSRLSSERA